MLKQNLSFLFENGLDKSPLKSMRVIGRIMWAASYRNMLNMQFKFQIRCKDITVELQWPEHLWNHENMFETKVVRANEC